MTLRGQKILVVDDEAVIRDVVRRYLEHDGFAVCEAADGEEALAAIREEEPDLIILDLMLPLIDGWTLTRLLHREASPIPIIMLTARNETNDRIRGLDQGADDYVVKPFSPREVVSRVRAVLRRARSTDPTEEAPPEPIEVGDFCLDYATRRVTVRGKALSLTAREFDLLWFLARHPAQVFTREQLLDSVWGYDFHGDASTVTVHIRRLREKVEDDPSDPRYIATEWGVGYRFRGAE